MKYPTLEEVETADVVQLAEWHRFLKSPGMSAAEMNPAPMRIVFEQTLQRECMIMDRITERFTAMGGMTPLISKNIGWDSR